MEGLLLSISIAHARDSFCEEHCSDLQDSSSEAQQQQLFEKYQSVMETAFLAEQQQQQQGAGTTLQALAEELQEQEGSCNEEVCDLLLSVSDLGAFVALLADFKQAEVDRATGGGPLEVQGSRAGLHADEQEDGRSGQTWTAA